MELFPLTKDIQAFLVRATASLERADAALAEVQLLTRDVRQLLEALRTAAKP